MSFAQKLANIASSSQHSITQSMKDKEAERKAFQTRAQDRYDELMIALTQKYARRTYDSLVQAAQKGYTEKYINFDRKDFMANFPGLGNPKQVQKSWLNEMMNPQSKYLINDNDGNSLVFDGIRFDIWNNGSFTTHFLWGKAPRNRWRVI